MENAKHTPGPWVFEHRKGDHPLNDQDGWGCDGLWSVNGGLIFGSGQNWDGTYSPPNDANAALIAAAPELLAFAQAVATWEFDSVGSAQCEAEELIAKAKGDVG